MRAVVGLESAIEIAEPPFFARRRRLTASGRKGITWQNKVGKHLQRLWPGRVRSEQWFCFYDANGQGYAQPDHFVLFSDRVLLVECKLTQKELAEQQMELLYKPILEHIYHLPVACLQAFLNMRWREERMIETLAAAQMISGTYCWHGWGWR